MDETDQNILKLAGKSENNLIQNNQTMGSTPQVYALKVNLSGTSDFSSNVIDFGKMKNEKIKSNFLKKKIRSKFPKSI